MKYIMGFTRMDKNNIKIAFLSGKGGTGKTLVSVNLAYVARNSMYVDCDVEEPNGYLFFKPEIVKRDKVRVKIPKIDNEICNGCRKCVDFCNFNALAYANKSVLVFDEVCHSCGGCTLVCSQLAIHEENKDIGIVEKGFSNKVKVYTGTLNIGEASGIPIINHLIKSSKTENAETIIIDCPPGSACIVMESIKDADYCLLVAEPSIFGADNLKMVHELVKIFKKKHGAVLNKYIDGLNPSEKYCVDNKIRILGKIPFDSHLGTLNSNAQIVSEKESQYNDLFSELLTYIEKEVKSETIANT